MGITDRDSRVPHVSNNPVYSKIQCTQWPRAVDIPLCSVSSVSAISCVFHILIPQGLR